MKIPSKTITALVGGAFMISLQVGATPWADLLAERKSLLSEPASALLEHQQELFAEGKAPIIAAPCIKAIEIVECGEKLVDVREVANPRILMLPNSADGATFNSPKRNAGFASSPKMRKAVFDKLVKTVEQLDSLAPHFGYEPGQISILVFEGLRDLSSQALLFGNKVAEIKSMNSGISNDDAEVEASKWVSPVKNNVPVHSTGAAVDIRLWNNDAQDFIDAGIFGAIWGPNPSAPTYSEDLSDTQKLNRLYLLAATANAGLTNYVFEHWHFSSGDRYATWWNGAAICGFGPALEKAIYGAM